MVYLQTAYGVSPWVCILVGMGLAALAAACIGALSFRFRVKGHYFGLLTLACSQIAYLSVSASLPLGRSDGLILDNPHWGWAHLQFRDKWPYAVIGIVLLSGALVLCHLLQKRRLGYYMRAVRDNEDAAEALGVPSYRTKMVTIMLSAAMTGLGGAFYALYFAFVDPRSVFGIELSIQLLVFCIVGGIGTLWGPVLGVALLVPVGEFVRTAAGTSQPGASAVVYALVLILIAMLLPRGLASLRPAALRRSGVSRPIQGAASK